MTRRRSSNTNATYYDSNFGHYEIEGPEDVEFYHQIQKESKLTTCSGCGERKRLRPGTICNECAETLERGGDLHPDG